MLKTIINQRVLNGLPGLQVVLVTVGLEGAIGVMTCTRLGNLTTHQSSVMVKLDSIPHLGHETIGIPWKEGGFDIQNFI